jgi:hypothetical protein
MPQFAPVRPFAAMEIVDYHALRAPRGAMPTLVWSRELSIKGEPVDGGADRWRG